MTALEHLNVFLRAMERRLRWLAALRGFAASAIAAFLLTLAAVAICNRYQFAQGVVWPLRVLLFLAVAGALAVALVRPVLRLTRRRVSQIAENKIPALAERLLTVTEHPDTGNPFTELVAEDALRIARENAGDQIGVSPLHWIFAGAGTLAVVFLVWLISAGPGYWGYGSRLLWTGFASAHDRPLYEVVVTPGDKTIRRKSDQIIRAQLVGFSARAVTLHVRNAKAAGWEQTVMQAAAGANAYQFLLPAVVSSVEYYVQADGARSRNFKISVKDLPSVKRVRVHLHFPGALGLQDVSEDPGGDVRAVQGTVAEISVLTDRLLEHGVLVLNKDQRIELVHDQGNWSKASFAVKQDGSYHIAAIDSGEAVRLSDDYFIEAKKDEPPTVRIVRISRDLHVSPIEEVPVGVEAADDYGVKTLELHYSLNGGAEQIARFKTDGHKDEQGHTTLYLENFKLAPGDVVSLYASASDANTTTRSDILFAQTEPFDFKFSQSQQMGGMNAGGMGNQDSQISERQKQIIAATFNQLRGDAQDGSAIRDQARFLADMEGKLSAQARTLAERMGNRELSQPDSAFENFAKLMTTASGEMQQAAGQLSPAKWRDALVPEQKALQSLLRAEALFRDIQVAFGQQGGGAGGSGAQRDLARMFDLELDTSKNQYETAQKSPAQAAADQQKALDDAFQRLQMLANRQQQLAEQRNAQQPAEQRWQEEQLRREAEELKRQLEQLAKNSQQGSPSAQADSQNSASAGQGSQSSTQNRALTDAMRRASESVSQAEEEMRGAVSSGDRAAQQRASGQLAEAQRSLRNALHENADNTLSGLSQQAAEIAARQHQLAQRLKQMYGQRGRSEFSTSYGRDSGEMPEMNDPDNLRFSFGYRRRAFEPGMRPFHQPTPDERSLASDKDQLAGDLENLQRGMSQEQERLRTTAPDAARQVQKALSEAEQKELALRMQKNAQWIREGFGDRNLDMEDNVTAGVEQLSRDLAGAQQSLDASHGGKNAPDQQTAEALAQVRRLRQMLERSAQRRPQSGAGKGQGTQQAQQAGDGQTGTGSAQLDDSGGNLSGRDIEHAIDQLSRLRGQISGQDRALGNYFGGALGYLRDLNADPRVLQGTISQDAVASLERLEAELSRRLGEGQTQGARSASREQAPEQYRDAVAEYFKKLSEAQPK